MRTLRKTAAACTLLALMPAVAAAAPSKLAHGTWTERQPFVGTSGQTIHFYLFTPSPLQAGRKYPLVLWLHGGLKSNGVGGPNMPADAFYRDADQAGHPCFVLRPVALQGKNWVSPRGAGTASHVQPAEPAASMAVLLELVDNVLKENPIDRRSLHVCGASMGGYGTWDLIERRPEMFASAAPICGGGDPQKAERLKDAKIWIFHSADDRIVPVAGSRDMFAALMKARGEKPVVEEDDRKVFSRSSDGRIRYIEFKSGGHNAWDRALGDPALREWMLGP
jgi:predicted peptidase